MPHGVSLRRRFRTRDRTITGISDEALDGSLADAAGVDDFLLEELERARDTRMRDIVATIQADQYGLIAREPEPALVIQGGPGTGKTAVGLHRASYLLFAHRASLRRILVVGPNPTFMDYVSHVPKYLHGVYFRWTPIDPLRSGDQWKEPIRSDALSDLEGIHEVAGIERWIVWRFAQPIAEVVPRLELFRT